MAIRRKVEASIDAKLKAHVDLMMHQNTLQWSRFMPLYWLIASSSAAIYFTRSESILLRSAILFVTAGVLIYLYCTILLDWLIKIKHANIVTAMGIDISGPTRPSWWPPLLPPFDILALSILYLTMLLGTGCFFVIAPFLDRPPPIMTTNNTNTYTIVVVRESPTGKSPSSR